MLLDMTKLKNCNVFDQLQMRQNEEHKKKKIQRQSLNELFSGFQQ
jgi:hypothetical protein